MKRFLSILIALSLLTGMLGGFPVDAAAAEETLSGTCGDNVTWELSGHILVISGTGDMYDYSATEKAPWAELDKLISVAEIQNGVTSIGAYAFGDGSHLPTDIRVGASVTKIGAHAFGRTALTGGSCVFYGPAPEIAEDAFRYWNTTVYTLYEWDEEDKQNYGGGLEWQQLQPELKTGKMLYEVNEPMLASDYEFLLRDTDRGIVTFPYSPLNVMLGAHDHSSTGQKTVSLDVDGFSLSHTYYVTDGQAHLDLIRVELGDIPVYTGGYDYHRIAVTVTAGSLVLKQDQDYTLTYKNHQKPTYEATVTVTGKGTYAGYEKTFTYPILRRDIANTNIVVGTAYFEGQPVRPSVTVTCNGNTLARGTDYCLVYDDDVNAGTGTVRIVGMGSFYGCAERQFQILTGPREITLKGNYLGNSEGTLSEDYAYSEMILSPGKLTAKVNCSTLHLAGYALYRVEGEDAVLVTEYTSEASTSSADTAFVYDFSSIYEGIDESSGEVYLLSYSWLTYQGNVYGGMALLAVPSKVGPATAMTLTEQEGLGNFRMRCLDASGTDGDLGEVAWSSSDTSVATVKDGVVTFKKPGKVTVTARSGDLAESVELKGNTQMLGISALYAYSPETGATVLHNYRVLEEGTDYTLSVEQKDGQNVVTVTGCGLFVGQLVRSFDAATGEGAEHTHIYVDGCDTDCNSCKETRAGGHSYAADWSKNTTHHWHACAACGDQGDKAEHTFASGDSSLCTVCGKLYLPGDFDGDWIVTESDVIWLLWHTIDPDGNPLVSNGDFNGDGAVTEVDVIHLLWHTIDPDSFPLT